MRNVIPCPSPNGTNYECLYIVREPMMAMDAAMDPDAAQAGAAPDAYEALCTFLQQNLSPDVLGEAEALLRRFVDKTGDGNLGTDEPPPPPRPGGVLSMDEMQRRVAVGAKIRAGKVLAQQSLFNKRFPDAARIRSV